MEYLNPLRFLMKSFTTSLDSKVDLTLFSMGKTVASKVYNYKKNGRY